MPILQTWKLRSRLGLRPRVSQQAGSRGGLAAWLARAAGARGLDWPSSGVLGISDPILRGRRPWPDLSLPPQLKEHPEKGVYVKGLSLHTVHSVAQCERIMETGWKNRSVGYTLMNKDSSRSHSIFTISIEIYAVGTRGCGRRWGPTP